MNNHQRIGAISNSHVGSSFEQVAERYFLNNHFQISAKHSVTLGFQSTKVHYFDFGGKDSNGHDVIIECKSHKWTSGDNVPSAKLTVWNEAMLYFSLAPRDSRKILFVLKDYSIKRRETIAEYYKRVHGHLIPQQVEILELDPISNAVRLI
ncbi:hypothetical protein CM49_05543 [Paenibacillus sp. P1XP2]|jgi:hypothetical protein|nr:hypothetical protein CM49_05543 [Paenibacillus sp. P1XP2]